MSKYTDQYNVVLGSQPQLPLAVLGPNDKFDSRRIPHNVADGTIRVAGERVGVGRGTATARATLDVEGGLVVEGNVNVLNGIIFGQIGESEVSVKDRGAVADGVTDDTAAFQACLDSDTPTVNIPAGTYAIHGTLIIRKPVRLAGFPGSVILKRGAPQNPLFVVRGTNGVVVRDVEVRDLEFSSERIANGNASFFTDALDFLHQDNKQACFSLVHCDGFSMSNCTIRGFSKGVVTSNGRSTTTTGTGAAAVDIDRCVFDRYAIGLLTSRATDIRVSRSTFREQRLLEGEEEAHAWFNVDASSALALDDVYFDDAQSSPVVHWRNVDGGIVSSVRVHAIDSLVRIHECRHIRLDSVVGDAGGVVSPFMAVTSDTALRLLGNPNKYDVEISDVHVRLVSRAVHIDHHDVVCVRDCVFSYVAEVYDAVIKTAAHFRQDHAVVLRNLTVRFKNFVPTMPVASLNNATLDTLHIISDMDAYSQDMDLPTYVACVGSFVFRGTIQLWIEQGLSRRSPVTTVWSVAKEDVGSPSYQTTQYPALTLEPTIPNGLLSTSTSAHGATVAPAHPDSTVRVQLKGGQPATSLFTNANKAPVLDGIIDSQSNRVSEYSHAFTMPPSPGAFRLRIAFYIDAAFAATIPFDQSTPFIFMPWMIPAYANDAQLQSHLYVNSERDVIMYYRTAWYDGAAHTKRAVDGQWEIATNVWHEMTLTYTRTAQDTYRIVYAVDNDVLIDRPATAAFPFVDAIHIGSHGWKQGVWVGDVIHETLEIVQQSRSPLYEENSQGLLVIRDGVMDVRGNVRLGASDGPLLSQGGRTPAAMSHLIPIPSGSRSGMLYVQARATNMVVTFQLSFLRVAAGDDVQLAIVSIFKNTQTISFEVGGTNSGVSVQYAAPSNGTPFTLAWTIISG